MRSRTRERPCVTQGRLLPRPAPRAGRVRHGGRVTDSSSSRRPHGQGWVFVGTRAHTFIVTLTFRVVSSSPQLRAAGEGIIPSPRLPGRLGAWDRLGPGWREGPCVGSAKLPGPLEPGAEGGEGVHGPVLWSCRGLYLASVTAGPILQMRVVRAGGTRASTLCSLSGVAVNVLPGLPPPLAPRQPTGYPATLLFYV